MDLRDVVRASKSPSPFPTKKGCRTPGPWGKGGQYPGQASRAGQSEKLFPSPTPFPGHRPKDTPSQRGPGLEIRASLALLGTRRETQEHRLALTGPVGLGKVDFLLVGGMDGDKERD